MKLTLFNISPRLFISYSRNDKAFANAIYSTFKNEDYTIFFDTESINIGDVFPERIMHSIRKCDGCIVLISPSSVNSEWCKLETYYAHFCKKPLIPVRIGNLDYYADSPLKNIQENIHYINIKDDQGAEEAIQGIRKSLTAAKQKAKNRVWRSVTWSAFICLTIVGLFLFGINRINQLDYNRNRSALLSEITRSTKVYRAPEIDLLKQKFNNDKELIAQLHFQETDPGLSDVARINSKMLAAALLQSFAMSQRQYIKDVDWEHAKMDNTLFANATFNSGYISLSAFRNIEFDDVYFCGIDSGQQGTKLSGLEFLNCSFNTVSFDRSNAIDLKFKACRFRGSVINTSNFGAVTFLSDTSDNSSVITNGTLTYFENCVFQNSNAPDPPGVIVLGKEEEMQFLDVVFESCQFSGLVRPEWFKHCTFNNCLFSSNSVLSKLKGNNIVN